MNMNHCRVDAGVPLREALTHRSTGLLLVHQPPQPLALIVCHRVDGGMPLREALAQHEAWLREQGILGKVRAVQARVFASNAMQIVLVYALVRDVLLSRTPLLSHPPHAGPLLCACGAFWLLLQLPGVVLWVQLIMPLSLDCVAVATYLDPAKSTAICPILQNVLQTWRDWDLKVQMAMETKWRGIEQARPLSAAQRSTAQP